MPRKTVEFERIEYNKNELFHASGRFVGLFAEHSGLGITRQAGRVIVDLHDIIKDSIDARMLWKTPAFDIWFYGFSEPSPCSQHL